MLIAIIAVVIVAMVPLCGGRFSRLVQLQIRGSWLVAAALAIQVAIISVFDIGSVVLAQGLHLLTYVMIGVCMLANRAIRWIWVLTLGWACNFVAIAANAGVMPTSAAAARALDRNSTTTFENSAPLDDARLTFLGDVFITPAWMPMRNVFSIGDVILLVGLSLVTVAASRREDRPGLAVKLAGHVEEDEEAQGEDAPQQGQPRQAPQHGAWLTPRQPDLRPPGVRTSSTQSTVSS